MANAKHTPGPWVVGANSQCGIYVDSATTGATVAEAYPDGNQDFEANASLIAATPDLLAACEAALDRLEAAHARSPLEPGLWTVRGNLKAAIAKAKRTP